MAIAFTILLALAGLFLYVSIINAPEVPPIPSFKPQFRSEMEALKTLLTENGGRSMIIIMSPADADFMGDNNRRVTFAQVPA